MSTLLPPLMVATLGVGLIAVRRALVDALTDLAWHGERRS